MRSCFLILVLVSLSGLLHAQPFRVQGIVEDAQTGKLLTDASVFINNGSKGTTTNTDGSFLLTDIPYNTFELVISFVSYETIVVNITPENIGKRFRIKMVAKQDELEEVIVGAVEKDGWKKWGKVFTEHFIGKSAYADKCVLLNPETLLFRYNKTTGILKVMARDHLRIRNNALGYNIKYQLEKFEYDPKNRFVLYLGYIHFDDLVTNRNRKIQNWNQERKEAYDGSMMHFMRSFYAGKLAEEGFSLRELIRLKRSDKSARPYYDRIMQKDYSDFDTSKYFIQFSRVNTFDPMITLLGKKLLNSDSIKFKSDTDQTLMYFNNDVQVTYHKELESPKYLQVIGQIRRAGPQTSIIYFSSKNAVVVQSNGLYFQPLDLYAEGYWAFEKLAELLPTDYKEE